MNRRLIQFVKRDVTSSFITVESVWKFNSKGRLLFLQKLAWKLLHKLGSLSPYIHENVSYECVTVDTQDLLANINMQQYEL